jgi:hypothetical protein
LSVTLPTNATTTRIEKGILGRIRMPVRTKIMVALVVFTKMLLSRQRDQMVWVHAGSIAANMMQLLAIWNRAIDFDVS